jgi:hypothetical protein
MPIRGMGFRSGLLRAVVYGAGPIALVTWLGWWSVLVIPLLFPLVWSVQAVGLGISHLLRASPKTR